MRSLWMAGGAMAMVLALAVLFRPADRPGRGIAQGASASVSLGAAANVTGDAESVAELPPLSTPQGLETDDLSRIVELRAEIGSPLDQIGGEKVSRAAFEQELRQMAGLEAAPVTSGEPTDEHAAPALAAEPVGGRACRQSVLRDASFFLDEMADLAEEAGNYSEADRLRDLATSVRRLARPPLAAADHPAPARQDEGQKPHDDLIDNAPTDQAK